MITPEMNQRRAELIRKKNRVGLDPSEKAEYDELQRISQTAIEKAFPAPVSLDASVGRMSIMAMNTNNIRAKLVQLSHDRNLGHLGSCLSCVDILVALYDHVLRIDPTNPNDPNRDRFILSKGHAAMALYCVLAKKGFFEERMLDILPEQPSPNTPGVEWATGSLGHGLGVGLGMALAGRMQNKNYRVYVLMSDGELNEGSVWEAAMFAAAHDVGNLTAIIDYNKWQATGRSQEIMAIRPLGHKWEAFGWRVFNATGHNIDNLFEKLTWPSPSPKLIIAHTIKGKGVSFMEDDNNWHYRIPNDEELTLALQELRDH